jgi:putative ABC transport system permease protein
MVAQLLSDLRFAGRMLRKSPVFAVASLSVLSIGIAVNTAAFSAVSTLIRKPLPFQDSERLVMIRERNPEKGLVAGASYSAFEDWKRQSAAFEEMGAVEPAGFDLSGGGEPMHVSGGRATAALFRTLGLAPLRGRAFTAEEERAGGNRVVMIGQRLWERRFGADPNIAGRTLTVDGESAVILGVVPRISRGYFTGYDVWAPLAPSAARERRSLQVVARLKPGVPVERARAELETIAARLAQQYPETNRGWGVSVFAMNRMMAHVVPAYTILLVVLFLLLSIVCTNIANLQLARAAARRREIAVRLALGATRLRVVWQMMSEGLVLAGASGALGMLLVVWVRSLLAASVPELSEIAIGTEAALFTVLVSLATGTVFGLAPALSVSQPDLGEALKSGGRGLAAVAGRRLRSVLVVSELAIAMMLLVGLGVLVKGFFGLHRIDAGFPTRNLLAISVPLPQPKYAEPARRAAFYRQAVERLEALPGVESAGAVSALPLAGASESAAFEVEGRRDSFTAHRTIVTPEYFSAIGIALRRGRSFNSLERDAVVLNDRAAQALWPGEEPVGKRVRLAGRPWQTVVGVTGDARQVLTQPAEPEFYEPYGEEAPAAMTLVLRTKGDPKALAPAARSELRALDAALPFASVQTMDDVISGYLPAALVIGIGAFCGMALLLAAVGLYGVISYLMAQRTQEIGVRMALGAGPGDVIRLALRQGARLAGTGAAIGLAGALALTRLLSGLLFGVSPADPVVFTAVPLLLLAVAFAACYAPARRATRVSPVVALRCE